MDSPCYSLNGISFQRLRQASGLKQARWAIPRNCQDWPVSRLTCCVKERTRALANKSLKSSTPLEGISAPRHVSSRGQRASIFLDSWTPLTGSWNWWARLSSIPASRNRNWKNTKSGVMRSWKKSARSPDFLPARNSIAYCMGTSRHLWLRQRRSRLPRSRQKTFENITTPASPLKTRF